LSTRLSSLTSTQVLVDTGSTLIQAVNDEEGGSRLVMQRIIYIFNIILMTIILKSLSTCKWNREAQALRNFEQFVKW